MVTFTVMDCCSPLPLPVTVIGEVPGAAPASTLIVIVELPLPGAAMGLGLKLTVIPGGTPLADSDMVLSKPPLTVVVIVEVATDLCVMLREEGDPDMANDSGTN